jgi:hypothetical protein
MVCLAKASSSYCIFNLGVCSNSADASLVPFILLHTQPLATVVQSQQAARGNIKKKDPRRFFWIAKEKSLE